MTEIIDGDTTHVHINLAFFERFKGGFLTSECIENLQHVVFFLNTFIFNKRVDDHITYIATPLDFNGVLRQFFDFLHRLLRNAFSHPLSCYKIEF
ncbi:hypothetical protein PPE03_22420 [Pseudoalteromonas peptidolytica]|nr:hypothetical protein PPE03_22420 [Pseudoalteromonas peptidolytica]